MPTKKSAKKPLTLERVYPYLLIIGAAIGLLMSFIIMMEKIHLLKDPSYVPECSINPIISCGNVMKSKQASAFGFANPILGLIGFPVVMTIGMAMLGGAKFKKWFWQGLQVGAILGVVFCMWLFFEAVYRIGALCPYCIVVWIITIMTFLYTTIWNVRNGFIKLEGKSKQAMAFVERHHGDVLFVWYLIIFLAILTHFWYYWKTLI
jgi:uncharacterized membrane protein